MPCVPLTPSYNMPLAPSGINDLVCFASDKALLGQKRITLAYHEVTIKFNHNLMHWLYSACGKVPAITTCDCRAMCAFVLCCSVTSAVHTSGSLFQRSQILQLCTLIQNTTDVVKAHATALN